MGANAPLQYSNVLPTKPQDDSMSAALGTLSEAEMIVVLAMRRAACASPSPLLSLTFISNGWRLYESLPGKWVSGNKQ